MSIGGTSNMPGSPKTAIGNSSPFSRAAGIFGGIVGLIYMFGGMQVARSRRMAPFAGILAGADGLVDSSGARRDVEDDPFRLHLVDGSRAIAVGRRLIRRPSSCADAT